MILGQVVPIPTTDTVPELVRCDRHRAHGSHEYVANPHSPVVLTCPGVPGRRSLAELALHPAYAGIPVAGVQLQLLAVSAA